MLVPECGGLQYPKGRIADSGITSILYNTQREKSSINYIFVPFLFLGAFLHTVDFHLTIMLLNKRKGLIKFYGCVTIIAQALK